MYNLLLMVAALGLSAAPATAQTSAQTPAIQTAAPAPQPETVTKQVCERVEVERSTGSRLSSTTRLCKMVDVPVAANRPTADTGSSGRH